MTRGKTIAVVLLLASLAQAPVGGAAMAQPASSPCAPRAHVLSYLLTEYGETPVAQGLLANGNLLEVLSAPAGSWTILVTRPDLRSCITASGEAWNTLSPLAGRSALPLSAAPGQ